MRRGDPELEGLYGRVTRRIVPLLLVGYIVAYLDRVNVGFAKLQMLEDLRFSETVYGLGAGMFFVGYFVLEVPSNLILHRIGARIWMARIMIVWGVISAAMMFVSTPLQFHVLRFLLGAAEAGFFPGIIYYLTLWYPASRRGRITALFMTGVAISSVVGSVLSGWILHRFDGVQGLEGWQWMFVLEGLPAVVLGLCLLWRLDDGIATARWLGVREKDLLRAELAREATAGAVGSLREAFIDPRVWLACAIYFCIVAGLYGTGFWLPTIVAEFGIGSTMQVGGLTAIPYCAAAIAMVVIGRHSDRLRERRWHVAVCAAAGALGLALSVLLGGHMGLSLAALTVTTVGILSALPIFWSLPTAYLHGAAAAAGIAVINSFGNLAGFASPYFVGWVKDATGSTGSAMYGLAAVVFAAAVLVVVGIRPGQLAERQAEASTA